MPKKHLICLVTDRRRLAASTRMPLQEFVAAAARAGIDMIQVRERDLAGRELTALVRGCVAEVARIADTPARVVVNDRLDVAIAANAGGVHLRHDSFDPAAARRLVASRTDFLIGRSIHRPDEAASLTGPPVVDYAILGTVFATPSKDASHPLLTMTALAAVCATSAVPVLAIGGITLDRACDVVKAGASGIAAIGLFIPPQGVPVDDHLRGCVGALRRVFDTCGSVP